MHPSASHATIIKDDAPLPSVSVVMPFYNQYAFVEEALESVFAQAYPNFDVILVDDGSAGGSLDRIAEKGWRIEIIQQANAGPAAARNTGIRAASGDVIAFLDSDDRWPAEKLARQVAPLIADPSVDIVLSKLRKLVPLESEATQFRLEDNVFYSLQLGCALVRRRVFESVGLFDEALLYSEDQDWFLRAREARTNIVRIPIDGLHYRSHAASLTRRRDRSRDFGLIDVLKRSLSRRRGGGEGRNPAQSLLSLSELSEWKAVE